MEPLRLPDFLIIGAMKSGTTTLYRDLLLNPHIFFPADKEPSNLTLDNVLTEQGRRDYGALFARAERSQICGEASTLSTKLPCFPGVPRRAHKLMDRQLKLIYIVREPVSRSISHHRHSYGRREMSADFEEALAAHPELISYGCYAMQARAWLEYFDPDRLKVVVFEEYIRDRKHAIEELSQFLGVPSYTDGIDPQQVFNRSDTTHVVVGGWERIVASPVYRRIVRPLLPLRLKEAVRDVLLPQPPAAPPPPSAALIERMIAILQEDTEHLARMMGRDQPIWNLNEVREKFGVE